MEHQHVAERQQQRRRHELGEQHATQDHHVLRKDERGGDIHGADQRLDEGVQAEQPETERGEEHGVRPVA